MFPMISFLKNLQRKSGFFYEQIQAFRCFYFKFSLVLALNPVTTFAAEPETSVVTSESNAVGGWSETEQKQYLLGGVLTVIL